MKTIRIENLAQFKRFLKVGQRVNFEFVNAQGETTTKMQRTITVVQSNSFALTSMNPKSDASSWCDYPKAANVTFIHAEGENTKIKIVNNVMGGYLIYQPV